MKIVPYIRFQLSPRIHLWPIVFPAISFFIALLSSLLFSLADYTDSLSTFIINLGLDPSRSQLTAALLTTTAAAFIATCIGRSKAGGILGVLVSFWFSYLSGFIQLALQPQHDPGGLLEPLNNEALFQTVLTILALALLCAFIGVSVGQSLAEVIIDPCYQFILFLWQRFPLSNQKNLALLITRLHLPVTASATTFPRTIPSRLLSWLTALLMIITIFLASTSGDLFLYYPTTNIHKAPTVPVTTDKQIHGTIVQDSLYSVALGKKIQPFIVYLPPSYSTVQGQMRYYPTLYLLHGSPGQDKDWFVGGKADQSADTLINEGKIPELIIISVDGNGRSGQTSEWGNSFDHKQLMETYVATELVHYIDHKYRTIASPAYRGIGGCSMGGFGSTNIAVHHPDVFGFLISLAGYFHAEGSIWGNNPAYIAQNSPADYLPQHPQAWQLHIYLGAATQDQPYYNDTKLFIHELATLNIPYTFDLEPGYHSWQIWQVQLYHALLWLHWGNNSKA